MVNCSNITFSIYLYSKKHWQIVNIFSFFIFLLKGYTRDTVLILIYLFGINQQKT